MGDGLVSIAVPQIQDKTVGAQALRSFLKRNLEMDELPTGSLIVKRQWPAANLAIFHVVLLRNREVEQHGNGLPTTRTNEKVLQHVAPGIPAMGQTGSHQLG